MAAQRRRPGPVLLEVAAWETVLLLIYLASLSAFSRWELVAGSLSALPAAVFAAAARRAVGASWRPRLHWVSWFGMLPLAVAADTARVFQQLFRRSPGRFREQLLPDEAAAAASARAALGGALLSATPSSYVADHRPDHAILVVHELGKGRPDLLDVLSR